MAERVIVRIYLPLEMGAVGRICKAVGVDFPDAVVGEDFSIRADPDITKAERRKIALARRLKWASQP